METTVRKDELIAILRQNRDRHRGVFEAALHGYRERAAELLENKLEDLEAGRTPEIRILLSRPEDHTRDYDRTIKMLEMDTGDTFTLSEPNFARYVMDDWDWKRQWLRMSSQYAADATSREYGDTFEGED